MPYETATIQHAGCWWRRIGQRKRWSAHKETAHYLTWRDAVADLMAEPRSSRKFVNVDPEDDGW